MTYAKGVFYERDLIRILGEEGFSTLRVAGSGHSSPADILAIRRGKILVVECKAHKNKPRLPQDKVREMKEFCERAGALGVLAWRAPKQGWKFLTIEQLEAKQYEDKHWMDQKQLMEAIFSHQVL